MKKIAAVLALCLLLTGCGSLLDRSYSVVEPYSARFWEAGTEDTLKAESYQDLVNSLLLLVEERAEEGHIRYYAKNGESVYLLAGAAALEVRRDTMLGSYLLSDVTFTHETSETYSTLNYHITYRPGADDPDSIMRLRDPQSLTDLLRLAVRENHHWLTARFIYDVQAREVEDVVEKLWQELHRAEAVQPEDPTELTADQPDGTAAPPTEAGEAPASPESGETPEESAAPEEPAVPEETAPPEDTTPPGEAEDPQENPELPAEAPAPEEPVIDYPPCPWEIRFYPNRERAELVEILLK